MNSSKVIVRPLVTEKGTLLQERGKYTFEIAKGATKKDVARAVEKTFNVTVSSVNTISVHGKMKRYGRKPSRLPDTRKAVVTLKAGDSIRLFEGA